GEVGDASHETQKHDLQQLLEWHEQYPVTDYERHRNDAIEDVQGNRNPFIDFPELARKVDFSEGFGG
ncbi:MAG: endonuclease, partial [Candidatus Eremiobacteraeota bacterium]|nr:endonuclease [Candidatus Eremiobacteraeota bacterium]